MPAPRMMIIAGEASGDMHGAKLAQALTEQSRGIRLFGVGGRAMQAQGVRRLVDAETLSVVGITEVFTTLPTIYRAMQTVKKALRNIKPDVLILIDFPDFNFRVAAYAKTLNIPVLYYISPQLWAWRQGRVKTLKRLVDHMAVIFPFEAAFYRRHRVPVTFVGHPLLDRIQPVSGQPAPIGSDDPPVIGLLPGSRTKEVTTLLPVMLAAAVRIQRRQLAARFVVSCSASIDPALVTSITDRYLPTLDLTVHQGSVEQVFKTSRVLVAASGTVTLEAALHGIPTIIIYKVSPLSYALGKRLIKVKHIGIVNLIVRKQLLPELIQDDASPGTIARTAVRMLENPEMLQQIRRELFAVRDRLGGPGASERVARLALNLT